MVNQQGKEKQGKSKGKNLWDKGYIKNNHLEKATGAHFNKNGHKIEHMKVCIIEKVNESNEQYRKEREKFFIQKFNTYHAGINRVP